MACNFQIKKGVKSGMTPIFVRIRSRVLKTDILMNTRIEVDAFKWNSAHRSANALTNFRSTPLGMDLFNKLSRIESELNLHLDQGEKLTTDSARQYIDGVVYAEQKELAEQEKEARKGRKKNPEKMTLLKFVDKYISEIKSGKRQTIKGTTYKPLTIKAINQALNQFKLFEETTKRKDDFDDIDLDFYNDFTAFLRGRNYSINSVGKCVKELKGLMAVAESEGYHTNSKYKDKRFKGTRVEVDSIYLTREDLDRMMAVDLSGRGKGYDQARDIFMVGVWTAQRISDYNDIKKEDIHTSSKRWIEDVPDPDNPGQTMEVIKKKETTFIDIRQKKTGAKVTIPCSSQLKAILEKYNYQMPKLYDQVINRYIKEIAQLAGLDDLIEIETTKGGTPIKEKVPKYKLVHSHTARRTGATLMYLSGIEVYDIMKITGHQTPEMLRKYIKADSLEVAEKLADKYDYFN